MGIAAEPIAIESASDIAQHLDYLATVAAMETVHRKYDPAGNPLPVAVSRLGRSRPGSQAANAKLTEEIVLAMRASSEPNWVWAERLGLSAPAICNARAKRTWKHI